MLCKCPRPSSGRTWEKTLDNTSDRTVDKPPLQKRLENRGQSSPPPPQEMTWDQRTGSTFLPSLPLDKQTENTVFPPTSRYLDLGRYKILHNRQMALGSAPVCWNLCLPQCQAPFPRGRSCSQFYVVSVNPTSALAEISVVQNVHEELQPTSSIVPPSNNPF